MRSFILILTWAALAAADTLHLLDTGDRIRSEYSKDVSLTLRPDGFLALEYGKGMSYPDEAMRVSEDDAYAELSESGTFDVVDEETRDLLVSMGEGGTPPFRLTVDFDRRARIRDAEGEVSWVFPDKPRVGVESIDSGGMNFLRSGDTMVGSGSDHYLEIKNGMLVSKRHSDKRFKKNISKGGQGTAVLTVNESGVLALTDDHGKNLWASGKAQRSDKGPYTVSISSEGVLQTKSKKGVVVGEIDLKTGPTKPLTEVDHEAILRQLEAVTAERDRKAAELSQITSRSAKARSKKKLSDLQREQDTLTKDIKDNRRLTKTLVGLLYGVEKAAEIATQITVDHVPFGDIIGEMFPRPDVRMNPEYMNVVSEFHAGTRDVDEKRKKLDEDQVRYATDKAALQKSHKEELARIRQAHEADSKSTEKDRIAKEEKAQKEFDELMAELARRLMPDSIHDKSSKSIPDKCDAIAQKYQLQPFAPLDQIVNPKDRVFYKTSNCDCYVTKHKYNIDGWMLPSALPFTIISRWKSDKCFCVVTAQKFGIVRNELAVGSLKEHRQRRNFAGERHELQSNFDRLNALESQSQQRLSGMQPERSWIKSEFDHQNHQIFRSNSWYYQLVEKDHHLRVAEIAESKTLEGIQRELAVARHKLDDFNNKAPGEQAHEENRDPEIGEGDDYVRHRMKQEFDRECRTFFAM